MKPPLFTSLVVLASWLTGATSLLAAFGLSTATDFYTVDTGAGLVFKVRRTDNGSSTQSAGDLMSLVYNGVEYQNQTKGSHINSGFDFLYTGVSAVSVSASVINANFIRITVAAGDLTHYYMARNGYPHIYMATYFTSEPDTLGLCRFIVRVPSTLLPNGPPPSDIRNNTGAIESADIFGMADGTTRSKHYSNMRLKDWSHIGATGTNVGLWMVRSNHEGDSGGPFYRSLLNQCGSDQEITYIINYGEAQTEPFRTNILNGPYALVFTTGAPPPALDTSWVSTMGLVGFVGAAGRGTVTGAGIAERDTRYAYTVGFANSTAQYWTAATAGNGAFTMPGMLPGSYTLTVYKNELAVYSTSAVVNAGAVTSLGNITIGDDPSRVAPLWRIGNWDGTPNEFLNGDKVTTMHPSDVRMADWNTGTYVVGTSTPASGMPAYQWRDVNGSQAIQFNLTPAQVVASTVRVGITCAYEGARPKLSVNSWSSSNPSPSTQPDTRSLTVGTYRGNNAMFTFAVPANAFVAGTNTLWVFPISGSGTTGFLSAGYSLDCVELYQGAAQMLSLPALTATAAAANTAIVISWTSSSANETYTVERALVSGGPYTVIANGLAATTFTDPGLLNGTPYFYRVTGTNSSGTGLPSGVVSATPGAIQPVVHLRFDETSGSTAADSSGNGWNGTLAGAATFSAGKYFNAVSLPGANTDRVTLPANVAGALNDLTICAWVKPSAIATWSRVFDFGTGTNNYLFFTPRASTTGFARFAIRTPEVAEEIIDGTAALTSGAWTHVAVTISGSTGTLYVNGVATGTNTGMTLKPASLGSTTQNYLGDSQFALDPSFNGLVDDFRIFNRALTAAEVAAFVLPNYENWQAQYFTAAQSAIATPGADANNDGYKNLLAYALATSPWSNLAGSLPVAQRSGGYLTTTFRRRLVSSDITYSVEVSGDLATWAPANSETDVMPIDAETEQVTVRDNVQATGQSRRFLRIRITR
jgi:rhamnogalacturonan endolyase